MVSLGVKIKLCRLVQIKWSQLADQGCLSALVLVYSQQEGSGYIQDAEMKLVKSEDETVWIHHH